MPQAELAVQQHSGNSIQQIARPDVESSRPGDQELESCGRLSDSRRQANRAASSRTGSRHSQSMGAEEPEDEFVGGYGGRAGMGLGKPHGSGAIRLFAEEGKEEPKAGPIGCSCPTR